MCLYLPEVSASLGAPTRCYGRRSPGRTEAPISEDPVQVARAGITAWVARWSGLLAVAAQRAYATFLLELLPAEALCDGPVPEPHEIA